MIVLRADLNGFNPEQQGIFSGDDPVADNVIAFGDPLFGSNVSCDSLGSTYRSLSDNGDIAFTYSLPNGRSGVAIARLVSRTVVSGIAGDWRPGPVGIKTSAACLRREISPCRPATKES
jgi:hypothetical protein